MMKNLIVYFFIALIVSFFVVFVCMSFISYCQLERCIF